MGKIFLTPLFFILIIQGGKAQSDRPEVVFDPISKLSSSFGKAYTYDGAHIYAMGNSLDMFFTNEYETYYVYTFETNAWEKVKFPANSIRRSIYTTSGNVSEFLPGKNMIITMGNPIEILDVRTFVLTTVQVQGGNPWLCGSAVWNDRVYIFGGTWKDENVRGVSRYLKGRPVVSGGLSGVTDLNFVFDNLTFSELARMPDKRYVLGKFVNDKLYTLGGAFQQEEFNDILVYDPQQDTWATKGHLPRSIAQNAIISDGKFIYVTGFSGDKGYLGVYDPSANAYKEYATNLKFQNGALVIHDGGLYFFGGIKADAGKVIIRDRSFDNNKLYRLNLGSLPSAKWFNCSDN